MAIGLSGIYYLSHAEHPIVSFRNRENPAAQVRQSEFYEWATTTPYRPINETTAWNASIDELCRSFPQFQLHDVQPVLKSGHGVLERVRHSLRGHSACLDGLLIFSDAPDVIGGHPLIDVLGDIPESLMDSTDQTIPYRDLLAQLADDKPSALTMSATEGWKTDKFKFLPTISRAWMMAPEKRWYVFYEGDTYVVWDTVFRLLSMFDADKPHYFGSPSPGREGIWFANGGPGFILSREAVRRIVKDDYHKETGEWLGSAMVRKYWNDVAGDCCGDSVLGWVLHEAGVHLKGLWPLFNPHPLHGIPFSDLYWCQPVLSLHKTFDDDVPKLWRWEWANRRTFKPILYRDIAQDYFNFTSLETKKDWDNGEWDSFEPNADDPYEPHKTADTCASECDKAVDCLQWTYHKKKCIFVRTIRYGRQKDPTSVAGDDATHWTDEDRRFIAGWSTEKIQKWMDERPCHQVEWVRPSTSRIF
ncbi:Hypothetical protein D9617_26g078890 [Elsinoe fawcettii]|nr:Hypothetical protein D9617_26g078890 [Elsinoe fawcettii]